MEALRERQERHVEREAGALGVHSVATQVRFKPTEMCSEPLHNTYSLINLFTPSVHDQTRLQ